MTSELSTNTFICIVRSGQSKLIDYTFRYYKRLKLPFRHPISLSPEADGTDFSIEMDKDAVNVLSIFIGCPCIKRWSSTFERQPLYEIHTGLLKLEDIINWELFDDENQAPLAENVSVCSVWLSESPKNYDEMKYYSVISAQCRSFENCLLSEKLFSMTTCLSFRSKEFVCLKQNSNIIGNSEKIHGNYPLHLLLRRTSVSSLRYRRKFFGNGSHVWCSWISRNHKIQWQWWFWCSLWSNQRGRTNQRST